MDRLTDTSVRLATRGHLAGTDAREWLADVAQHRLGQLRDETGAQAAEYAMLGGVSAAACGALVYLLKETDALDAVVSTVVDTLTSTIGSWF